MAATVLVAAVAPLAGTWTIVDALKIHTVMRAGAPADRWTLVRPDPGLRLPDAAIFSTVYSLARPDRVAEIKPDEALASAGLAAPVAPVAVTASPPANPVVAVTAEVIPLPPVKPVRPEREEAKTAAVQAGAGATKLAAAASSAVARRDGNASQAVLTALRQRVQPALPEVRRDDVTGSISAYNNPDPPREVVRTAVYDIATHTVHMPNGERLEAHSGLGVHFDDPRSVHVKNLGATPPNLYDLKLRERPFHGVAALRMTPVGTESMFGRDGFLAHSYMLGPRGDSNGCVSFRDYDRFLQSFRRREVSRILVLPRLTGSPASAVARARLSDRYAANGKPAAQ